MYVFVIGYSLNTTYEGEPMWDSKG